VVQRAYRECAEHYGFLISPCRPRTPEHKGKVEQGGVHYLKRNFLGGRSPTSITQANADVLEWCRSTAGNRIHGSTFAQPRQQFEQFEQAALRPLPATAYDLALWKQVTAHRDCHIVFENAFYSVPFRLIGQQLRVRGASSCVQIYADDYSLVATHPRAQQAGERHTHPEHLPPDKLPGLELTRESCLATAADIGEATSIVVRSLLEDPSLDRLPTVGRLLRLREQHGEERLERACARAVAFGDPRYATVKGVLTTTTLASEPEPTAAANQPTTFARSAKELLGHLFGGVAWT
jgi:Mu transposase-like protein